MVSSNYEISRYIILYKPHILDDDNRTIIKNYTPKNQLIPKPPNNQHKIRSKHTSTQAICLMTHARISSGNSIVKSGTIKRIWPVCLPGPSRAGLPLNCEAPRPPEIHGHPVDLQGKMISEPK